MRPTPADLQAHCFKAVPVAPRQVRPCLELLGHDVGVDATPHRAVYLKKVIHYPTVESIRERN